MVGPASYDDVRNVNGLSEVENEWALLPPSIAKPQPGYIPQALRDGYARPALYERHRLPCSDGACRE
jgi:hypothetical protein